ncbi:MAG: hypothetical protein WCK18_20400 [Prolixibacteraceae bacterium]
MTYKNPTVRKIYVDEEDFEIIAEIIEAKITKLRASSEQCSRGYGSGSSIDKAKLLTAQADRLRSILSHLGEEMI